MLLKFELPNWSSPYLNASANIPKYINTCPVAKMVLILLYHEVRVVQNVV